MWMPPNTPRTTTENANERWKTIGFGKCLNINEKLFCSKGYSAIVALATSIACMVLILPALRCIESPWNAQLYRCYPSSVWPDKVVFHTGKQRERESHSHILAYIYIFNILLPTFAWERVRNDERAAGDGHTMHTAMHPNHLRIITAMPNWSLYKRICSLFPVFFNA